APKVRMDIAVATPGGYAPDPEIVARAKGDADMAGTKVTVTTSIDEAVKGADVVETDVWASMGQEEEAEKRRRDFDKWQVDRRVMSLAKREAIFMHCLPAHRGEEVAAEVIDSEQSVIYDEAENRLHVQKEDGLSGWAERNSLERTSERQRRLARYQAIRKLPALSAIVTRRTPLYAGPGIFYPVVGELSADTQVSVFTRDHDFYALDHDGGIAYADVDTIDVSSAGTRQLEVSTATPPATETTA